MWNPNPINIGTHRIKLLPIYKKMSCPKLNEIPKSPKCEECNKHENVSHFTLQCRKYKEHRQKFFKNISKISYKFRYQKFRRLKYILFPYKLYHTKIHQHIAIWKELLSYIRNTNRLSNLYVINTNEI